MLPDNYTLRLLLRSHLWTPQSHFWPQWGHCLFVLMCALLQLHFSDSCHLVPAAPSWWEAPGDQKQREEEASAFLTFFLCQEVKSSRSHCISSTIPTPTCHHVPPKCWPLLCRKPSPTATVILPPLLCPLVRVAGSSFYVFIPVLSQLPPFALSSVLLNMIYLIFHIKFPLRKNLRHFCIAAMVMLFFSVSLTIAVGEGG